MMTGSTTFAALLVASSAIAAAAEIFGSDIISDITSPEADEGRALEIKEERFWSPVAEAAKRAAEGSANAAAYDAAQKAICALDAEHTYVKETLHEALALLRRADASVVAQGAEQARLAADQLRAAPMARGWSDSFSFFSGGQWGAVVKGALRRFIDGGHYEERVGQQIQNRRDAALPALRGSADVLSDVLGDCRKASGLAFDVLKYDIYNRHVPKTPSFAKEAADKIVEAARNTRRRFMGPITEVAKGITKDSETRRDHPSATVTRELLHDLPRAAAEEESLVVNGYRSEEWEPVYITADR